VSEIPYEPVPSHTRKRFHTNFSCAHRYILVAERGSSQTFMSDLEPDPIPEPANSTSSTGEEKDSSPDKKSPKKLRFFTYVTPIQKEEIGISNFLYTT
jgi:hypothetical protein